MPRFLKYNYVYTYIPKLIIDMYPLRYKTCSECTLPLCHIEKFLEKGNMNLATIESDLQYANSVSLRRDIRTNGSVVGVVNGAANASPLHI